MVTKAEAEADADEHNRKAVATSPAWQLAGRAMPPTGRDDLYKTTAMPWGWDHGWRPIALERPCAHCAAPTNLRGPDGKPCHPRCAERALESNAPSV